jgi:hypothetical protein
MQDTAKEFEMPTGGNGSGSKPVASQAAASSPGRSDAVAYISPQKSRRPPTTYELSVGISRLITLVQAEHRRQKGIRGRKLFRMLGASGPTLWRLKKAFAHGGFDALLPRTWLCGGKPRAETSQNKPIQP